MSTIEKVLIKDHFKKNKDGDYCLKVWDGEYFYSKLSNEIYFYPDNKLFDWRRLTDIIYHIKCLENKIIKEVKRKYGSRRK